MRVIERTTRFKRDYKREASSEAMEHSAERIERVFAEIDQLSSRDFLAEGRPAQPPLTPAGEESQPPAWPEGERPDGGLSIPDHRLEQAKTLLLHSAAGPPTGRGSAAACFSLISREAAP